MTSSPMNMYGHLSNFDHEYLTTDMLKGFSNYKYSAVDTSPLSTYVMHPFWNKIVALCPKWVAPNLLTFSGFAMTVSAWTLLAYYDWNFYATPVPPWVLVTCPALIFIGYTLDGIDGKQARITKTSGPLGELFDHGLDSWTAVLIPCCLYSVFGRGDFSVPPVRYYFVLWNVFLTFYMTHWEKYITGTLYLPWGYDFSMISTCACFLVTYKYGIGLWGKRVIDDITSGQLIEAVFYLSSVGLAVPVSLFNVYKAFKTNSGKHLNWVESIRPAGALATTAGVTISWALLSRSRVVENHPRAFYMMTGNVFSNIACRLVVAQMSASRCSTGNPMIPPLFIGFLASYFLPIVESVVVYGLFLFTTYAHLHYGICVVRQMCKYFDIRCFKIRSNQ